MRGVACIVVEKQDVNAGASGGNHGLLHSGARYVVSDPSAAHECHQENQLLKKMAAHCIETTGGLFVAIPGDDEKYIAGFAEACGKCQIPVRPVDPKEALEQEPSLSPRIIAAFAVEDATIDPFKLSLDNIAHAQQHGARLLRHSQVMGFDRQDGRIRRTQVRDALTGQIMRIEAEIVINATGAWAGVVAQLAGTAIPMRYSKGTLLVTQHRLAQRVINRLRLAASGDILVPAGTVSILGTSSERVDSPDVIYPEIHEVDAMIDDGRAMVPALADTRYIRAYCGVRPLVGSAGQGQDDRSISRGFALIDHSDGPAPLANFISITGGKLTTYRLMAEKTADLVCAKLGITAAGRTHTEPLPDTSDARWTQPGLAPDMWLHKHDLKDILLCECEMVPQSVVEELVASIQRQGGRPSLKAIGLRSRIGKGPCQGTFCGLRLAAHLYNRGHLQDSQGVEELRAFLRERWRGQQPLLWDTALAQAELLEAMHCGLFGLELKASK
jgi:glycerol-3-phosphate dehydrogenase